MEKISAMNDTIKLINDCCPEFNVAKWDNKDLKWDHKHFIKASVPAIMHIPFTSILQKKILKLMAQANGASKMEAKIEDALLLFTDPHPFRSDIYLSVTDEVSGANNVEMTGNFLTKVFEGNYNEVPKFFKRMNKNLRDLGKRAKHYFVHYAYYPKCAKTVGTNYTIVFAKM